MMQATTTRDLSHLMKLVGNYELMSANEVHTTAPGDEWAYDIECYPNLFYIAFKHLKTGKIVEFESSPYAEEYDNSLLGMMMFKFLTIGFNSIKYDNCMAQYAMKLTGSHRYLEMKTVNDFLFSMERMSPWQFRKHYNLDNELFNHIDLIEVAPLVGSLKLYGARLHSPMIQDLPFDPQTELTYDEIQLVKRYCINDLDETIRLYNELRGEIKLRAEMSVEYNVDLRSKSDAQIAEHVIEAELMKANGGQALRRGKPSSEGVKFDATKTPFLKFCNPQLIEAYELLKNLTFYLDANGSPIMPTELAKLRISIGSSVYKLGMGGLHSTESTTKHIADENFILDDTDVGSFYPRTILNQGLYPGHLGDLFLSVYKHIVDSRLEYKAKKDRRANTLKIVINGLFGKFGNKYSLVYSPQLMLQVTLTGQLVLLMLIERLEMCGIPVVSGNTDGIICHYHKDKRSVKQAIVKTWERETGYEMEETNYLATFSRDVNSYFALTGKTNPEARFFDERVGAKTKGFISERGSALNSVLSKNPEALICNDAVIQFAIDGTPVEETIRNCTDIRRFVSVKNVKGGGVKNGVFLGKVVRWYYGKYEKDAIVYRTSGNKVAKSDGAVPLMVMDGSIPTDLSYEWYIAEAKEMLINFGVVPPPVDIFKQVSLF